MSVRIENFYPASNYTLTGTNTSTYVTLTQPTFVGSSGQGNNSGYSDIQFVNPNSYMAFANWSMGTATASTSGSVPIPPSSTINYNMGGPMTSVAVILGTASSGVIYISLGSGM